MAPYTKMVDGRQYDLSPAEIAERQAEEAAWLVTKAKNDVLAQLAAIDAACGYNRGLREVILAFGTLTKLLHQGAIAGVPDTSGNVGMVKVQALEDQAKALRAQLAALPQP